MPFTSETAKLHRGPGHRRTRRVVEEQKQAAQLLKEILAANAARLGNRYIARALGKAGDRVLTHAIDKLLPDEHDKTPQQGNTVIQFIFGNERREIDVGLPQEEQRGNLNGGSIRLIGDEGGS